MRELYSFKGSPYLATNMASKFHLWMVIMCLLEEHLGFLQSKQMMITLEDKSILASLIELVKSLILDLMRLTWSCFLVW
jgi:hypothetical protein